MHIDRILMNLLIISFPKQSSTLSIGFLRLIVIIELCNISIFCIHGNDSLFSEIASAKPTYHLSTRSFEGVFRCEVLLSVC